LSVLSQIPAARSSAPTGTPDRPGGLTAPAPAPDRATSIYARPTDNVTVNVGGET
jgi:hypothetical protein